MKRFLLPLMIIGFWINQAQAQRILLLPETTASTTDGMPMATCIQHSSQLINSIQDDDVEAIEELRTLGYRLMRLGQHKYAKDAFDKLLDIVSRTYPRSDEHYYNALLDLARVYVYLIRYDESIGMYSEVLTLAEEQYGKDSYQYILALSEETEVYFYMREISKGIVNTRKIREIEQLNGRTSSNAYVTATSNLGACYKQKGDLTQAATFYEEAMRIVESGRYPVDYEISIAANLAEVYAWQGKKTDALGLLDSYMPLAEKKLQGKVTAHARVWLQFAAGYMAVNAYDKSFESLKKAMVTNSLVYDEITDIPTQAEALMFDNQFLAICAQAGSMMYTTQTYKQMYQETGDIEVLKEGYQVLEVMNAFGAELQASFSSEKDKLILFEVGASMLFDMGIYFAYELYEDTQDMKYLEDAFRYSEMGKSTLLLHTLENKKQLKFGSIPEDIKQQEIAHRNAYNALQKRFLETTNATQKDAVQAEINELNRAINQFRDDLKEKYPAYYEHHYNTTLATIEEVQASLKEGTAMIEYRLGEQESYAFYITKDAVDFIRLDWKPTDYENESRNLRKVLSDYDYIHENRDEADVVLQNSAYYFYQNAVAPLLAGQENIEQLVIIPDGFLGHLPFEIFLTEIPTSETSYGDYPYLLKDYAISYSYSATLRIARQEVKVEPKNRGALGLAGDYSKDNEVLLASAERSANISALRKALQPLPGAQKEVELMEEYMYGEFFTESAATERIFKEKAGDYNIIHLAMHGLLDVQNPIRSSLAFSEDGDEDEDNFLHAYEIADLDLTARLVVLSACETGYGKFRQGEGIMSLAHSFIYAGASSVVMSLWQVNDISTGKIMQSFYMNMSEGMAKDEALRQAKLAYVSEMNGLGQHPAYWAAFVPMGDTEPMDLVCKLGYTKGEFKRLMWVITIGVILLTGGFFRWRRKRRAKARG